MDYRYKLELQTHEAASNQYRGFFGEIDYSFIDLIANNRWLIEEEAND